MHRSYLFAPGHNEKLLGRVFDAGADAVMLDLEDAVPPHAKQQARAMVADVLAEPLGLGADQRRRHRACRRRPRRGRGPSPPASASPRSSPRADVRWVRDRAPGTPLICAIESARGILAAPEIAPVAGVRHLSLGGVDLRRDLGAGDGNLQTLYARSHLVVASRAAGIEPPDRQRLPGHRRRGRPARPN